MSTRWSEPHPESPSAARRREEPAASGAESEPEFVRGALGTDGEKGVPVEADSVRRTASQVDATSVSRPADDVDQGNLPSLVHSALKQDLAAQRQATIKRVAAIQNREQARETSVLFWWG
jgi:hypothetical protein